MGPLGATTRSPRHPRRRAGYRRRIGRRRRPAAAAFARLCGSRIVHARFLGAAREVVSRRSDVGRPAAMQYVYGVRPLGSPGGRVNWRAVLLSPVFTPIVKRPKGGIPMKLILALCGAALVAGCSSVPVQPAQKVESNLACDRALM